MIFAKKIRALREERHMPQRKIAAALGVDTSTYCKIEKGERNAKREQVIELSIFFKIDSDELIDVWLADQVYTVVPKERIENIIEILRTQ